MEKSIFGMFVCGAFKFDTDIISPFKCIKYYETKEKAEEEAKILNDYYRWNTYDNMCLWHKKKYNNSLSEYKGTFIRRNRNWNRRIYYIMELPDIIPSSFHYKLTDDDVTKVEYKYTGDKYLWYTIYCNKVKDAITGKFHIRQFLSICEEDYRIVSGAIRDFSDSMKVISFDNLTDEDNFIAENPNDIIYSDLKLYDIDKQKLKNRNSSVDYFIKTDSVLFNKSTVYGLYGNIHIPKTDDLVDAHRNVENQIKEELKKTETLIYNKFIHDIFDYKKRDDYVFDKITFEEPMYTAYGGIKWNRQFGYEDINDYY